ncbi:hypothetical protein [Bacillus stratosphericus]|nr:hypothetical protein [Bacillus stratosphericus]
MNKHEKLLTMTPEKLEKNHADYQKFLSSTLKNFHRDFIKSFK